MAAPLPCKPQQSGLFTRMLFRKDSATVSPTAYAPPCPASFLPSPTQDNDKLVQEHIRLKQRNEELIQQSEINQTLFQETSEALLTKEEEVVQLKACIRRVDEDSKEAVKALEIKVQSLAVQLAKAQDLVAEREGQVMGMKEHQHQQLESLAEKLAEAQDLVTKREAELADLKHQQKQRHQSVTKSADLEQHESHDTGTASLSETREMQKTIEFLRHRHAVYEKRETKLRVQLKAARGVDEDWVKRIMMVNEKIRERDVLVKAEAEAEADAKTETEEKTEAV